MASNGLMKRAKHGKCRMCGRVRNTDKHLMAVGEVHHGFATGHIWECKDVQNCEKAIKLKPNDALLKIASKIGRFKEYNIYSK